MIAGNKKTLFFLAGDVIFLYVSLFAMLLVRYQPLPSPVIFKEHLTAFSLLTILWVSVFFIAGLYDKNAFYLTRRGLLSILFNTQVANSVIAVFFFYLLPFFRITPKTNLFLFIVISYVLIFLWRRYSVSVVGQGRRQRALLAATGETARALEEEVNKNPRYAIKIVTKCKRGIFKDARSLEQLIEEVKRKKISVIVVDMTSEEFLSASRSLYGLLFSGVRFVDFTKAYEDVFDRLPLAFLGHPWFVANIQETTHTTYDFFKRVMDIVLASIAGACALFATPFIASAIFLESGRPIFIRQKRIGQNNETMVTYKFRSMQRNEDGVWISESDNKVTRVGRMLRATRLDELPQLWSVFSGDMSLIGPRPDIAGLNARIREEVPYYDARYLIKPGLSGWAQIKQDYGKKGQVSPQSIAETKMRLAYDLYYIKSRSFVLDLVIALRTLKVLISRKGN